MSSHCHTTAANTKDSKVYTLVGADDAAFGSGGGKRGQTAGCDEAGGGLGAAGQKFTTRDSFAFGRHLLSP